MTPKIGPDAGEERFDADPDPKLSPEDKMRNFQAQLKGVMKLSKEEVEQREWTRRRNGKWKRS